MNSKTTSKTSLTYAGEGVDIEAGDQAVQKIQTHMKRTFGPRVFGPEGGFAGCFRLDFNKKLFQRNYREPVLAACTDSVGSKVLLAANLGIHNTIGQDCVAMNVNDLIVQGAEPLFFLDYIGIHKVIPDQIEQIVQGVADGCEQAGCALIGGETCEMPEVYQPGDYDLAGFAVGVSELGRIVDGQAVEEGDVLLGLKSSGVHSNGYTLVRAVIREARLDLDKTYSELTEDRSLGQILLEPTRIYAKPIVNLLEQFKAESAITAMAHITGGGLAANIMRLLPSNLNARIKRTSWVIPPVFHFLQSRGRIDEQEMFRVFNMGIGFVLTVRAQHADQIAANLSEFEQQVCPLGIVTAGTGQVQIL